MTERTAAETKFAIYAVEPQGGKKVRTRRHRKSEVIFQVNEVSFH